MSKALRVPDYLGHMLQAIERINRYTAGLAKTDFLNSELVQDAVLRNLEIVGEASSLIHRVAPAFTAANAGIPWQVMYVMRNRIALGYAAVDMDIVWQTIQGDQPGLHNQIKALRDTQP